MADEHRQPRGGPRGTGRLQPAGVTEINRGASRRHVRPEAPERFPLVFHG